MIEQYPDKLVRENGDEIPCRFNPGSNGKGIKKMVDGVQIDVAYTIALSVDAPQILQQELVSGFDMSGEVIIENMPVALFHRGQLHCIAYI